MGFTGSVFPTEFSEQLFERTIKIVPKSLFAFVTEQAILRSIAEPFCRFVTAAEMDHLATVLARDISYE
ncbi:MAG: hypothetical protein CL534_11575 [Ahrensia sp.]|nr:hypothetical protein [Ahrensia sp.]